MRNYSKYIAVFIAGALLAFSGQAVADSVSKIGKKVQGEVVVKVDGVPLEAKGLIVDGQTSVPARALAEASGYDVSFENKEVILTKKEAEQTVHNVPEIEQEPQVKPEDLPPIEEPKAELTLDQINDGIVRLEGEIDKYEKLYSDPGGAGWSPEKQKEINDFLGKKKAELEVLKILKADLEKK